MLDVNEFRVYLALAYFYKHLSISHVHGEYVRGDIHTDSIEGSWALLKRGIIGIYHFVSVKHLECYFRWFLFRYNPRKEENGVAFNKLIRQVDSFTRRLKITDKKSTRDEKDFKKEKPKEDSFGLDMDFEEAVERFLNVDPKEIEETEQKPSQELTGEN